MTRRSLREECGYSLVEVMASIIILTLAILPMVGMFEMGLTSATRGSNYDKARALANLKMEEAKGLPFATVKNDFPVTGSTPDSTTGYHQYDCNDLSECDPAIADAFLGDFKYRVEKQVMRHYATPTSPSIEFKPCNSIGEPNACSAAVTGPIRLTVTVQWGDGNMYTIYGLVT